MADNDNIVELAELQHKSNAANGVGFEDIIALEFAAVHAARFRYVAAWNRWLRWDGQRWVFENTLSAFDE